MAEGPFDNELDMADSKAVIDALHEIGLDESTIVAIGKKLMAYDSMMAWYSGYTQGLGEQITRLLDRVTVLEK